MTKTLCFLFAIFMANASQAGDRIVTPTERNTRAIGYAIQSGADLSSTGLALVLDEVELTEIRPLAE